jgi:hypothetical protein
MASNYTEEYKHEHKCKAERLAERFQEKQPKLHRIEFMIGTKNYAVLLTDKQLEISRRKAAKKEMDLHEYYIDKYSM